MAFEIPDDLMVSVSGVRGRVGHGLTPEVVARFSAAFGAWLRQSEDRPRVVLARDSRVSGPMFSHAALAALISTGCDVISVGIIPTPTALFTVRDLQASGAIVVTASHNPVEWNALKFASAAGMFLDGDEAPAMRAFINDRPIPRAAWDALGSVSENRSAVDHHMKAILAIPYLDIDAIRRRRFKVALDCTRGAGGVLLPRLLEALCCEVVGLDLEPDGRFNRTPEPVAENLAGLEHLVRESGADVGMATDPDADRLSLVSDRGTAIGEDMTLALATRLVLRHRPGPVVTNLSTSRVVEDTALAAGVDFHRAPVGEINVARAMQQVRAVIGGEGNGGVILPDVQYTRDSGVALVLILQSMLEAKEPIGVMIEQFKSYVIVKEKLPAGGVSLAAAYSMLQDWEFPLGTPRIDRSDGLRLEWPEAGSWLHLRPSGTEPIYRIIAEAPEREGAEKLVEQARQAVSAAA